MIGFSLRPAELEHGEQRNESVHYLTFLSCFGIGRLDDNVETFGKLLYLGQ